MKTSRREKATKPETRLVSARIREEDFERMNALAERWPLVRGALHREALRLGLDVLERDGLEALERG